MHAAVLLAHGNNDNNVMTKNATAFYEAVKQQGLPHQFFFHQGGHGGAPPDVMVNRWFTKYLYGVDNGVQNQPHSWVVRSETGACPPRESTLTAAAANTTTVTVADASPFPLGFTLTIGGVTRLITNISGNTLTLASAVTAANGSTVS